MLEGDELVVGQGTVVSSAQWRLAGDDVEAPQMGALVGLCRRRRHGGRERVGLWPDADKGDAVYGGELGDECGSGLVEAKGVPWGEGPRRNRGRKWVRARLEKCVDLRWMEGEGEISADRLWRLRGSLGML